MVEAPATTSGRDGLVDLAKGLAGAAHLVDLGGGFDQDSHRISRYCVGTGRAKLVQRRIDGGGDSFDGLVAVDLLESGPSLR